MYVCILHELIITLHFEHLINYVYNIPLYLYCIKTVAITSIITMYCFTVVNYKLTKLVIRIFHNLIKTNNSLYNGTQYIYD